MYGGIIDIKFEVFKETVQVTSGNDKSGNFCDHDINSLHKLCYILPNFYVCILTGLTSSNVFSKIVCIPNSRILVEWKSKSSKMDFNLLQFACRMSTRNSQRKMLFWTREFIGGLFKKCFQNTTGMVVRKTLIFDLKEMNLLIFKEKATFSLARKTLKIKFSRV